MAHDRCTRPGIADGARFFAQDDNQKELVRRQLEFTQANYTKYDYRIPMRDGVKLFTTVYVPKDSSQTYPILMQRTPYSISPYGIDNYRPVLGPSEGFEKEGFIFVYQDVRGRYLSEGEFIDIPFHKTRFAGPTDTDESTDTYDTVDWLIKHIPNNNGKVGISGISYPGFFAAFGMIDAHPALKQPRPRPRWVTSRTAMIPTTTAPSSWRPISASTRFSSLVWRGLPRPERSPVSISARRMLTTSICAWVRSEQQREVS